MIAFLSACAGLIVLSALFYLLPQNRRDDALDQAEANVDWLRLREQELAEVDDESLREEARLRLLEDDVRGAKVTQGSDRFPTWLLFPVVAVLSVLLYYQLGAVSDVMITREMESLGQETTEEEFLALITQIEQRASQRPDNLHYLALLGRFYMNRQEYELAARSYDALATAAPEDAEALAYAAQAEFLAAGRTLSDRARLRAEQALAVNPHQRTALGLLGMASFEQQQYRAAISYWERLLAVETPGSEGANMIQGVIDRARSMLGEAPAAPVHAAAPPAASPHGAQAPSGEAVVGAGVTVTVRLPEGAQVSPSDTVFVLARNAASNSRMPIAVQRLSAAQLPLTLRLDDGNSMAGQKLSETESVVVAVQLSPAGRPGLDNATWAAESAPLAPSADADPLVIELQPNPR